MLKVIDIQKSKIINLEMLFIVYENGETITVLNLRLGEVIYNKIDDYLVKVVKTNRQKNTIHYYLDAKEIKYKEAKDYLIRRAIKENIKRELKS